MSLTELHFHLLPGVDDGPETMEDAVALARAAAEEGTRTLVATPHVRHDQVRNPFEIAPRVEELRRVLAAEGIALELIGGGELGHEMVAELSDAELHEVAVGPMGGRFVLLEAPFSGAVGEFHCAANQLRARGLGVLVAHPERCPGLMDRGAEGARRELRRGARLQVNAGSLLALHGSDAATGARMLVGAGLVSAIASDAHGRHRPPLLRGGMAAARECGLPKGSAWRLAREGPARLLELGIPTGAPARAVA